MKFLGSLLVAFLLSVVSFLVIIGPPTYLAIQENISFWWLALAAPVWVYVEGLIAVYVFDHS